MNSLSSGYRLFCKPWWRYWFSPSSYYYWVKYKTQRANRGWADCDTWSLDYYLSQWLPDALTHLKKHTHGHHCDLTEESWSSILDEMIRGFRAKNRIDDVLYEDELGPYPISSSEDFLKDINNPSKELTERYEKSRELEKRDQAVFDRGMKLFAEHFQSLWD